MRNTLCRLTLAAVLGLVASTATAASSIVVTLDPADVHDVKAGASPRIEITNVKMVGAREFTEGTGLAKKRELKAPQFLDVVILKYFGAASPALFRYFVSGSRLKTVLIEFLQQVKGQTVPYFAIRLSDVGVTEYALGGSVPAPGSPGAPDTEAVRLNYLRIEIFHPESKQQTFYDLRTGKIQ